MALLRTATSKKLGNFLKQSQDADVDLPDLEMLDEGPQNEGPDEDGEDEIEEDETEEDEKEEPESDSDLEETVEQLVDAVSEMKEVLEEGLGLRDPDQDIEDFKEDEDDELLDDFTVSEFGIDADDLVTSTQEENMSINSLKAKRKSRLATRKRRAAYGDGGATSLAEEFDLAKDKKKRFGPKSDAPKITKVKKSEVPETLKLASLSLELNDAKDAWSVMDAKGNVYYTVNASALEIPAKVFTHRKFAEKIIKDMHKMGIEAALLSKRYKAEKADDKEEKKAPKKDKKEAPKKSMNKEKLEAYKKNLSKRQSTGVADHKRKWSRAARLAMVAMNKNLSNNGMNPLKAAFLGLLVDTIKLDGATSIAIVEEAFAEGSSDYMDAVMAQADAYMNMGDEAFVETESAIGEMEVKHLEMPEDEDYDPILTPRANALRKRAANSSIPVQSYVQEKDEGVVEKTNKLSSALINVGVRPALTGVSKYASQIKNPSLFRQ